VKHFAIVFLIALVLLISANNVPASGVEPDNPPTTNSKSAEAIVAELSDTQVRRLLIGQLKKEALAAALVSKSAEDNVGQLAGFVENIKNKVTLVQERIEFLRSGGKSDNQEMNSLFAFLRKGEADFMSIRSIFSVFVMFVVAYHIPVFSIPERSCFTIFTHIKRHRPVSLPMDRCHIHFRQFRVVDLWNHKIDRGK